MIARRHPRRPGLTLIEVLLAMSILAMAMAALSQLQANGVRAAQLAALQSEAVVICQSEMDACLAGLRTGNSANVSSEIEVIPDQPRWARRVRMTPATVGNSTIPLKLSVLSIEIYRVPSATSIFAMGTQPYASLRCWIDPAGHRLGPNASALNSLGIVEGRDQASLRAGGLP